MKNPTQEELRSFVDREVYVCHSMLVDHLLEKGIFSCEDITNLQKSEQQLLDDGYTQEQIDDGAVDTPDHEILEWWLVSNWLIERLEDEGEPVLKTDYGNWWGRTCTGQAILLDSVIEKIYLSLSK